MASELERIARLRAIYGTPPPEVLLGIGDDAAILAPDLVLSVDSAVEHVHVCRAWIGRGATWSDVGRRAALAALSDLAAMGARPRAMLSALVLPPDLDDDALEALARGIAEAASAVGAPVVGGNLSRGRELVITTTVVGAAGARTLCRAGAQPGDGIWVTGPLGAASLGLAALEAGLADDPDVAPFVARFFAPVPRHGVAESALSVARAAIDVSDGLVRDLGHVCRASGVGAVIDAPSLPLAPGHVALAKRLGRDPLALALGGGEDYELVFAAPDVPRMRELATRIGTFVAGPPEVSVRGEGGIPIALAATGYDHFADERPR
jgi:thiamine-monophosphate kinase